MKIGLIKEGKTPPDERIPISPDQCREVMDQFSDINIVVQKSNVRRFKAEDFEKNGVKMVDSVADCDVLMGVKEVPIADLIPNKTYFFFSHTIKKQSYNRNLLKAMLEKNITMVDYETLTNKDGFRLIGFGKYAGIVGCYNSFYTYGKRTGIFDLKRAFQCEDRSEMESELVKVNLPNNFKIIITGTGRVSHGAVEILEKLHLKRISPKAMLTQTHIEPVYAVLDVVDYNERNDGMDWEINDFFKDPRDYQSTFMRYAKIADMYIACHFWDSKAPFLFTRVDAKSSDFNLKFVSDISCDVDGPVASTIRPSTIKDPFYGYNPQTESEVAFDAENAITVMAVDNLPCELPKDASADFGREFIDKILPHLINDKEGVIERATICKNGKLMPRFEYLRDYVDGEIMA